MRHNLLSYLKLKNQIILGGLKDFVSHIREHAISWKSLFKQGHKGFHLQICLICSKKYVYLCIFESMSSAVGLCPNPSCFSFWCKQEVPSVLWELICKELCDPEVSGWGKSCTSALTQSPGLSLPQGLKAMLTSSRGLRTFSIIIYSDNLFTWSSSILGLTCIYWMRYFALGK